MNIDFERIKKQLKMLGMDCLAWALVGVGAVAVLAIGKAGVLLVLAGATLAAYNAYQKQAWQDAQRRMLP